jgi:DNA-binding MarR family transcriptional regulator
VARNRQQPLEDDDVGALVCACATVRRASRAVTQLYDAWLRAHGIEGPQFSLLAMLDRVGPSSQATMGRRFDLDKTTLSRNLRLLKQRGWIGFSTGFDARERRVTLTAMGRRRLEAARPAWRSAQEELRAALGGRDWDRTLRAIDSMTRAARIAPRAAAARKKGIIRPNGL